MREATSLGRKPASANNYAVPSRANSGLENTSLTTSSQIHRPEKDFHAKRQQKSKEQVGKYRRGKEKMPDFNITAHFVARRAGNEN